MRSEGVVPLGGGTSFMAVSTAGGSGRCCCCGVYDSSWLADRPTTPSRMRRLALVMLWPSSFMVKASIVEV